MIKYTKYQNIIDNYSTYNIVTPDNSKATYFVAPYDNGYLSFGNTRPYGIRMLITLSSDVLLSAEKTGTKTLTVTLNGDTYMIYAINFDTGNATLVEERGFSSGSSQQFPQESSNLDS